MARSRWLWLVLTLLASTVFASGQPGGLERRPRDGQSGQGRHVLWMGGGLKYRYSVKAIGKGERVVGFCTLACKGGKHARHSDCAPDCCDPCPTPPYAKDPARAHSTQVLAAIVPSGPEGVGPPTESYYDALSKASSDFQAPSTAPLRHFLENIEAAHLHTGKGRAYDSWWLRSAHWNQAPCSTSPAIVTVETFVLRVDWTFYDATVVGADVVEQTGPTGTFHYRVEYPVEGTVRFGEPQVNCRCEVRQEPPKEVGSLRDGGLPGDGEYAYVEDETGRRTVTDEDFAAILRRTLVHSMTRATFETTGVPGKSLFIPAGWELECVEGGGQDVLLCSDLRVGPGEFFSLVGGEGLPIGEIQASTLCLEIDKPVPKETMRYRLVPPSRPEFVRLAAATRASRFRGPRDQMRLWIATDLAPFAKIDERLIPSPGRGAYVREVYRCVQLGAVDPDDPRVHKLMESDLVWGPTGDEEATRWFVERKLAVDRAAFLRYLGGSAAAARKAFDTDRPEWGVAHFTAVLLALAESGEDEGTATALKLLQTAVPDERRDAVMRSEATEIVLARLRTTTDAKLAASLLDFLEKLPAPAGAYALAEPNAALPAPLRERATKLGELRTRARAGG